MGIVGWMTANAILSLAIISVAVTLIATLAHKWLTDQEKMRHLKSRQKEIQKQLKGCKDQKLMTELNGEMMSLMGTMFKGSFRPMIVTLVPFLILFYWLKDVYGPILGGAWIWYYIGFSVVSSIILRKVFKVV